MVATAGDSTARDRLAAQRSRLANERTALSYARTALAITVVGASSLHVPGIDMDPPVSVWVYVVLGWLLLALGLGIGVVGARRYRQAARQIHEVYPES
jgi:putative membrane protein